MKMKKRVVITALSPALEPSDYKRAGRALQFIYDFLSKFNEGKSNEERIGINVKSCSYHKAVIILYFDKWEDYDDLKNQFLYYHAEDFKWRG